MTGILAVGSSAVLGIVLSFLGGLTDNSGKISQLCQPPRCLLCAQIWRGYDVHESHAIENESLERRNLLKLASGVSELLRQLGTSLELGERNLQTKLAEMLPLAGCNLASMPLLLKLGGASGDDERATNANGSTDNTGAGGNQADKNHISHIVVAALIGAGVGLLIDIIAVWLWAALTMPNDQELSHAAGDCRQPESRSEN
jgi:hypothetical protein